MNQFFAEALENGQVWFGWEPVMDEWMRTEEKYAPAVIGRRLLNMLVFSRNPLKTRISLPFSPKSANFSLHLFSSPCHRLPEETIANPEHP
ncbi:hypothetical protein Y032_0414g1044 [Ancylostoma ceylanicum]|uniref:Uncharacterized protein n=1 Tax=Ancylostoma ceylanicum TaxID=53326 RepID=A0A016X1E2_9BILA|nr:hypothetical protein Y032_0414g1044 [Ancylostoma ceylanicum]